MPNAEDNSFPSGHLPGEQNRAGVFSTTRWTLVLTLSDTDHSAAAFALEQLCAHYWYPVYAFVRRRGIEAHDAEDLTQAFFAYVIEKKTFNRADREKGRFRTFLLAALTGFLNNEWDKKKSLKRGGAFQIISLDEALAGADERYQQVAVEASAPEQFFDKTWALALLEHVHDRLRREYAEGGKAQLFAELSNYITGEIVGGIYEALALKLEMKEEAVRMALSRLRRRFGELLRGEIGQTVAASGDVDDEIRHLFASISQ